MGALAEAGARVQRPLWASTSTKNPSYPDTLYVDELIGPDTVNTMPDATIEAARDHANAGAHGRQGRPGRARATWTRCARRASTSTHIVGVQLVEEGVASFAKSFDSMIETIGEKARSVAAVVGQAASRAAPAASPASASSRVRAISSTLSSPVILNVL